MRPDAFKCLLISNFNLSNLAGYLNNDGEAPTVKATVASFGEVMPTLLDAKSPLWAAGHNIAFIWTQPEAVIESFGAVLESRRPPLDRLLEEVDRYAEALIATHDRVSVVLVPTWVVPTYWRGLGVIDLQDGGVAAALARMNLRLIERMRGVPNLYTLNTQKWIEMAGPRAFNPKSWYMAKIPFGNKVFAEAAANIKAAIRAVSGQAKKMIVLDLDDTLWGGIVGEVGWQGLTLGGHDPIGEAFVDFQKALKALRNRGIVLAIASKNEEAVALGAIRNHPEMVLRLDDFAACRINWDDKARNIVDLVEELNLGFDSVVFIDDEAVERARVQETLPEVLVPDWPADKMLYKEALLGLRCFDTVSISDEDLQRTGMYVSERQRHEHKKSVGSVEQWLRALGIHVTIEELNEANAKRTVQLFNKTNQMNLSTRRMTESELVTWVNGGNRKLWCFRVSDRFGDSGLTGITSVECIGRIARIVDFILSCRVFGREIESVMVHMAVEHARSVGLEILEARYVPTTKNKPCVEFWKKSGFDRDDQGNLFRWKTSKSYALPDFLRVDKPG